MAAVLRSVPGQSQKSPAVQVTLSSQSAGSEGSEADIFLHLMFPGSSVLANSVGFVKGQMY